VQALYALPFNDLIFKAQTVHREHFDPNEVQISSLLSIKPVRVRKIAAIALKVRVTISGLTPEALMPVDAVLKALSKPRIKALRVFVWVLPGVNRKTGMLSG